MTPNPPKGDNAGSSQAKKCRVPLVDTMEVKCLSPEQWRAFKIMEALNDRAKIDKLRKEAEERRLEERKHNY